MSPAGQSLPLRVSPATPLPCLVKAMLLLRMWVRLQRQQQDGLQGLALCRALLALASPGVRAVQQLQGLCSAELWRACITSHTESLQKLQLSIEDSTLHGFPAEHMHRQQTFAHLGVTSGNVLAVLPGIATLLGAYA